MSDDQQTLQLEDPIEIDLEKKGLSMFNIKKNKPPKIKISETERPKSQTTKVI